MVNSLSGRAKLEEIQIEVLFNSQKYWMPGKAKKS